jgi:hypothetical protein
MKEEYCIMAWSVLFYHMELQYEDIVLRHSLEEFLFSEKRAVRYIAGLKHLESYRNKNRV